MISAALLATACRGGTSTVGHDAVSPEVVSQSAVAPTSAPATDTATKPATSPAPSTAPQQLAVVVPWKSIAPGPERTIPAPPKVTHPRCSTRALSLVPTAGGVVGPHRVVIASLRNDGAVCSLPWVTAAAGSRDGHVGALTLGPTGARSSGRISVLHAGATMQVFASSGDCLDATGEAVAPPATRSFTHVRIQMSSGQVVAVPGLSLNDGCGLSLFTGQLAVQNDYVGPVTAQLPGWGNVRAVGPLPNILVRGATITFDVTIRDITSTPFRLRPCPNYTIGVGPFSGKGKFARSVHGRLNCAAAPAAIPAHGSVTFAMRYQVPRDVPRGVAFFGWSLDQTMAGVNAANPKTGDAIIR